MANWKYKQSTGELFKDGKLIETGYSGALTNKNNPDRENVSKDTGASLEVVR